MGTGRRIGARRRVIYVACAIVLGTLVGLGVLEGGLWAFTPKDRGYYVWPPNLNVEFVSKPDTMPGVSGPARFLINSQGIRGPEMAKDRQGEYRILTIGGSTTECLYLDQEETWPHLLGEKLRRTAEGRRVWVGNIGKSGTSSRDHILAMKHVVPRYDVDAVVFLIGVNDMHLSPTQQGGYDPRFMEREENLASILPHAFSVYPQKPREPLYKLTRVWEVVRMARRLLRAQRGAVQVSGGEQYIILRERRRTARILTDLPDLTSSLDEYERNIARLVELGRRMGVRLVFLTQPTIWRRGLAPEELAMLWLGGAGDFWERPGLPYYSPEALARGMDAYNVRLLTVCHKLALECVDLARAVPKNLNMHYDDAHFNEEGARRVAEVVAGYFRSRPPFARTSTARRAQ